MGRIGPVVTPQPTRTALLAAAVAALVAGCAPTPEVVAGQPAPLTPVPTPGTSTATASASASASPTSSPASSPTPSRTTPTPSPAAPVLPTAYETFELAAHGVTVRLPVPAGWPPQEKTRGYDFGDPTGTLLLRLEVTARVPGRSARAWWQVLEPMTAEQLRNYRRLDARDVPGYLEDALDWTFVFDGNGGRRQTVDRLALSRTTAIRIYFSAVQPDFGRLLPVWDKAQQGLVVS